MTSSKGRPPGLGGRRPKSEDRPARATGRRDKVETRRRTAAPGKGGANRQRRAPASGSPRQLPFEGLQAQLMARLRPERFSRLLVRLGVAILALLLTGMLLMVVYSLSHGLRFFALREIVIHRQGTVGGLITDREIEQLVRKSVPEGVLRADLRRIRTELLQHDYIRQAQVRRLLPDTLSLQVTERVPVALARLTDGTVKCVDEDGTLFGTAALLSGGQSPPLLRGLMEDIEGGTDVNRRLLADYQKLLADLDRLEPPLSRAVDEVLPSETDGIRVILANSDTTVFLGTEDYRRRLNLALDVIDAVRGKDLDSLKLFQIQDVDRLLGGRKIKYINSTSAVRVTVGFEE